MNFIPSKIEELFVGARVIDRKGTIGHVTRVIDASNIHVDYWNGKSGIHSQIVHKKKIKVAEYDVEIDMYNPIMLLKPIEKQKSKISTVSLGATKKYLKGGRDYGEFCTDQIEQNAYELFLEGKLNDKFSELKEKIEARNPNTKIFTNGIIKSASINPLKEKRDYEKKDQLEQLAEELKEEGKPTKKELLKRRTEKIASEIYFNFF